MRSSFRDWAAECTGFPFEVAEMALAHAVGDKVETAPALTILHGKFLPEKEGAEWQSACSARFGSAYRTRPTP